MTKINNDNEHRINKMTFKKTESSDEIESDEETLISIINPK